MSPPNKSYKKTSLPDPEGLKKDKKTKKVVNIQFVIYIILDSDKKCQDAIFCKGSCNAWLHRQCAGHTKQTLLSNTQNPFYRLHCHLKSQLKHKNWRGCKKLTSELNSLKSLTTDSATNYQPQQQASEWANISRQLASMKTHYPDRKHNVIYGIQECPSGTTRCECSYQARC